MSLRRAKRAAREAYEAASFVHVRLGSKQEQGIYVTALLFELERRGFEVDSDRIFSLPPGDGGYRRSFRVDLVVDNNVLIEVLVTPSLLEEHTRRMKSYVRLTRRRIGLIFNFGAQRIEDGYAQIDLS